MKNKDYVQYEISSKSRGGFGLCVFICGMLLVVSICNIVGYAFFSSGLSFVSGKGRNVNNFYAVEVEAFATYDEAKQYATTLQQKGGAGYITYNKEYKVLTSLYLTYDDAKSVADKLKTDYPNSCVYELCLPEISMPDKLTKEQEKAITTSFAVTRSTIATMYNIYAGIDTGDIKETTAKTMLSTLYDDCADQVTSIKTAFHSLDTAVHLKHQMYLADFTSNIADITKLDLEGMELSQIIKYQQLKCAFLYITMANLFQ